MSQPLDIDDDAWVERAMERIRAYPGSYRPPGRRISQEDVEFLIDHPEQWLDTWTGDWLAELWIKAGYGKPRREWMEAA